jgi:hypothetical protein
MGFNGIILGDGSTAPPVAAVVVVDVVAVVAAVVAVVVVAAFRGTFSTIRSRSEGLGRLRGDATLGTTTLAKFGALIVRGELDAAAPAELDAAAPAPLDPPSTPGTCDVVLAALRGLGGPGTTIPCPNSSRAASSTPHISLTRQRRYAATHEQGRCDCSQGAHLMAPLAVQVAPRFLQLSQA